MLIKSLAPAALALLAGGAMAQQAAMPLNYAQFEAAVPHVDLETCPDSLDRPDAFCRATIQHEEIHVFVFSEKAGSPMIGFASFPADGMGRLLQ